MDSHSGWSRGYELKAVSLLAIGFGLVGLDRFIIAPLFPLIAEDLGLDYGDLGLIAGVLALTWGVASIAAGSLSDRVGYIGMVVVPALSDRVGRKPAMIAAMALAVGALTLIVFTQVGALLLAGCLFVVSAAISGAVAITVGPFVNASVPASIAASATGIVAGIGEMAGGAFAPALAGLVADAWGIQFIPVVSLAAAVFGLLVLVFGMKEPETRSR